MPVVVTPSRPARPVLIDPADGPCEFCEAWARQREADAVLGRHTCQRCAAPVLPFQNMGGNGFQGVRPHHWHLEMVSEVAGRRARYEELCHECYQADHRAAYPDKPVPDLPLVVMDINRRNDPKLFRPAEGEVLAE